MECKQKGPDFRSVMFICNNPKSDHYQHILTTSHHICEYFEQEKNKMKIRNGFVSNSSSSSFILATPKGKKGLKTKITIEIELEEMARFKITTKEELLKMYKDKYGYDEDGIKGKDWCWKEYQKNSQFWQN